MADGGLGDRAEKGHKKEPSKGYVLAVYSVTIRPLARENKASDTESKAIFTEAKATSIINMAHINV